MPTTKARPIVKRLSQCRRTDDTSNPQRVAKTAPTRRRVPSVPQSVVGRGDSTGGACALGGDGDDPPDHSHTIVDDGRDGEPEEDDLAEDDIYGSPSEPSPLVKDMFANPPRRLSGGELHPSPFPGVIHNMTAPPTAPLPPVEEPPSTPPRRKPL